MSITLAAARVNAGMSQTELGEALGVKRATVKNWESGAVRIPAIYLREIARISGVNESDIFLPSLSIQNGAETKDEEGGA